MDAPQSAKSVTHPDDEFHPPTTRDPFWTETCWFTFTVPERRLSGQFYPFFRPNQGVMSAAAYFRDDTGSAPADILHARHFWHLPIPDRPLSDLEMGNGITYRCIEPLHRYQLSYRDPDTSAPDAGDASDTSAPDAGDAASVIRADLTFTAIAPPNYLGDSHLDQPGRYQGTIALDGEEITVDSFGFRDRSWGPRSQFGRGIHGTPARSGGYSYATASTDHAFHAITMTFGDGDVRDGDAGAGSLAIHGYVLRNGTWSKVSSGRRTVLRRNAATAHPEVVALDLTDELGRTLHAEGRCLNGLGLFLNPNLYSVNCLTEWSFDGVTAYGEDHDNWSATGIREFLRSRRAATPRADHPATDPSDPATDPIRPRTHEVHTA